MLLTLRAVSGMIVSDFQERLNAQGVRVVPAPASVQRMKICRAFLIALVTLVGLQDALAASDRSLRVIDDWGRTLVLPGPAQRIVSLAPHATELLFSAGAGAHLVAVDVSSDHPPAVRALPSLNAYPMPDPERLLALKPDLIVAWGSGIGRDRLARLEAFGFRVFVSEPRSLEAVAVSIERFAKLTANPEAGRKRAADFRAHAQRLRARYSERRPVRVFIQAWSMPLTTLSDRDTIGDAIRLCGGVNPFADLPLAAPQVGIEAVLSSRPELVVAFQSDAREAGRATAAGADAAHAANARAKPRAIWESIGLLEPRGRTGFAVIDRTIQRPTERLLPAIEQLCEAIDARRSAASK